MELHPDKTRRIEFGRYAELPRKRRGESKPETFDFLGFTHISGTNRQTYEGEAEADQAATSLAYAPPRASGSSRSCRATSTTTQSWGISTAWGLSGKGDSALATDASGSQPETPAPLDPNASLGGPMVSQTARASLISRVSPRRSVSAITAVCANQCPYESMRGVPGNWYPYCDRIRTTP